ncbi:MAG: FAD-binding protein [Hyphomicrobiales bacterium]|nr:FAD-binding protein [Hyphomicrobiales bacterium]
MTGRVEFQKVVPQFDETFDVVVVGYGFAGGVASIQAARGGARVLLIEKMPDPGGISICSHGAICSTRQPDRALEYLRATNAGRTREDVLQAFAQGMSEVEAYFRQLGKICDAEIFVRERGGNYPLPGCDAFYYTQVEAIPNFDAAAAYPHARGRPGGPMVFKILQDNLDRLPVEIRLSTAAKSLIADVNRQVIGIVIEGKDGEKRIKARKGVILACGGFEANEEMKRQYWQMTPVINAAGRGNTGDGIRMAQELGAQLWHMWHFHGSYGFKHTDPNYPFAIRMKRFPDWIPGKEHLALVQTAWILVDKTGKRFMNELPPYVQDVGARPLELFDSITQTFPRIPAYMICDEAGRRRYPLGNPTYNDRNVKFAWSRDSLKEVDLGILKKAATIDELADLIGCDCATLNATIARWNAMCANKKDEEFGRPGGNMMPIATPPFYMGEMWPVVSNTQGGPVHNPRQQIIDVNEAPIPRLYAAGELGSSFGHLYLAGGNISECFVTGRIAGREVAALGPWD